MKKIYLTILFFTLCISFHAKSNSIVNTSPDSLILVIENAELSGSDVILEKNLYPIFKHFKKKDNHHHKLTAAILAFPFPFGIVGLHRIYLGTAPHVPVAYIGTLGGVFGILPLVDFFTILFSKDIENFKQNPHVIMWTKKD